MNLLRYIVVVIMTQTVRSNSIGSRSINNTHTDGHVSRRKEGVTRGDNMKRDFITKQDKLKSYDGRNPASLSSNNDITTSSEILLRTITSPKFDTTPLTRVKRGRSPRKKKCDPSRPETCRKGRRRTARKPKTRKNKNRKKCKGRKGRGRKKNCRKTPRNTPKPPPFNATDILTPSRSKCIRSSECPKGHCCARHHYIRICKPMKKEGDICSRPRRKNRRNIDHFELCECEDGLVCERSEGANHRLYTCQQKKRKT